MNTVTDGNLLEIDNAYSLSVPFRQSHDDTEVAIPACADQAALVDRARLRCIASGLKTNAEAADRGHDRIPHPAAPPADVRDRQLTAHAIPLMELLAMQIAAAKGAVVLADANGRLLHVLGDKTVPVPSIDLPLNRGACWSEASRGTNAIGTALAEKTPVTIRADEHYLNANRALAGTAAPIIGADGGALGVLAVVCAHTGFRQSMVEPVRAVAQMIANQMVAAMCHDAVIVHFSTRRECVGTLAEGIAVFAPDGRFLCANRTAEHHLGMTSSALGAHTIGSLFGLPVSTLAEHYRSAVPDLLELRLDDGLLLYGRPELRLAHGKSHVIENTSPSPRPGAGRLSCLHFLNTGDPQVATVIEKLGKVAGCNIPIMVIGETGTGKELLAHAIHEDSPRAKGQFVAVNCASIPESLIESELFGYEEGAFTGARKKGSAGKILQADGGTLFLDEIGDMPLNLQARLLRVLQERRITPLGGAKAIPVNLEVVCATNRNLRDMIAEGTFREDLYYRLNGLVVKLPPARDRTDLEVVINKILRAESSESHYMITPDVMRLFKQHHWPGNFRQMRNVLRTAIVMADDACEIRLEHLPDDFLDEAAGAQKAGRQGARIEPPAPDCGDLETLELAAIRKALEAHDGNVSAAARALGISRNTIYRKLGSAEAALPQKRKQTASIE